MIRVLLADDDSVVRFGLGLLLSGEPDLELVGTAEDGEEAVALAAQLLPDVVVMDLSMPRRDGLSAMRAIRAAHPSIRMLTLTMHSQESVIREAFEAGADGYLLKEGASEELLAGVREVWAGGSPMSPAAARVVGV